MGGDGNRERERKRERKKERKKERKRADMIRGNHIESIQGRTAIS